MWAADGGLADILQLVYIKKNQFGLCSFWLNKEQVPLLTEERRQIYIFYKKAFYENKMLIYRSRGNSSIGKDILTLEKGFICIIHSLEMTAAVAYKAVKLWKEENKCTNKWILKQAR